MLRGVFMHLIWRGEIIIIPELYENITTNFDSEPIIHNIIGIGQVSAPSPRPLRVIEITDSQFWQEWIRRHLFPPWSPTQYVMKLKQIRESYEPVRLVIVSKHRPLCINMLCLINFSSWEVRHGEENDIHYALTMTEHIPHEIKIFETITVNNQLAGQVVEPNRISEAAPVPMSYSPTIGDTLIKIAQKMGMPSSGWRELYDANKSIIGGNADLLSIGKSLVIPATWG